MIKQTFRQNKRIEFICLTIIYMNKIKLFSKQQLPQIIQYNKIIISASNAYKIQE